MRIGIFTELYTPSIGGMEVRHSQIAHQLINRGHQVSVYCIGHVNSLLPYENIDGVNVYRYPIVKSYKKPFIKALKRAVIPIIQYGLWSSKIMSKENFDFIIYNQWPLFHILVSPSKVRAHTVIDWCELRTGKFYQFCQNGLPTLSRFNMAVGPSICQGIEEASAQSTFYFPSGINVESYIPADRSNRNSILYVGRIAEHKNIPLLVEAFELLRDKGYLGRLQIAGQGPAFNEIQRLVSSSPCQAHIDLLGLVSEEKKVELLSTAELLVIPSKREGFPNIVAEAMASALPIVTPNYTENGTADILTYYQCGLVSEPTSESLANKMLSALSDWESLSRNALLRSKELDWTILVENFEKKILEIANSGVQ